jgi:hypothetical protein
MIFIRQFHWLKSEKALYRGIVCIRFINGQLWEDEKGISHIVSHFDSLVALGILLAVSIKISCMSSVCHAI